MTSLKIFKDIDFILFTVVWIIFLDLSYYSEVFFFDGRFKLLKC